MPSWALSLRASPEAGVPSADVRVHARADATVADLARALGGHLAPAQQGVLLVPTEGSHPWPAERRLAECGLRTGDLLDVVSAPESWLARGSSAERVRAVAHVTTGPDRGKRVPVRGSALTIGRGASCTLRLSDPLVSQQHARVVLGNRPTVHDEGSANGTSVGGHVLSGPREADWGTPITVGRTTVVLDPGEALPEEPAVSVFRSPRFGEPLVEDVLELPAPPTKPRPSPLPWIVMMMPVLMGIALYVTTRSSYALMYVLVWPFMGLGTWWQQKRAAERQFAEEREVWQQDVDELLTTIDTQAVVQRERAHEDYPEPQVVRERAAAGDPRTWGRSEDRDGFLATRLGIGTVPALLRGTVKEGGDRATRRTTAQELQRRDQLADMPVTVGLAEHPLVNGSFVEGGYEVHEDVHVGIAVAAHVLEQTCQPRAHVRPGRIEPDAAVPGQPQAVVELGRRARFRRLDELADQRVAVRVRAGGGQADDHVARARAAAVDIVDADTKAPVRNARGVMRQHAASE